MPKIHILDVTNRDGVQTSRLGLAKLQKTLINLMLNDMGIFQSEFGFPFTGHEVNYLNANIKLAEKGALSPIRLSGWCTVRMSELESAFQNVPGLKHINISISTSDQMIKGKFQGRKTKEDIIQMMIDALDYVKSKKVESVGVNAEDASRTDMDYLVRFCKEAAGHGADRVRYCDTLGRDDPLTIYERVKHLAQEVGLGMELHCHNDLGMAVACSVSGARAAVDAGVDGYINTCVNGMGERAGNADLVSVVLALKKASGFVEANLLDARVDLSQAWRLAKYASYAFGVPIPINQPAVGENAFAHESGIHVDGALKDYRNYELYHFEELGRGEPEVIETGRRITIGEYSGIRGFRNIYDKLEIAFKDDAEAARILELVRYANVHTQKPLVVEELRFIARHPQEAKLLMSVTP
ncbi:MAG: homocitrate synthase [Planctomycetes bacterium DG_23]|nr:MAG: homocitrate synthase [Planctomycetes bacterium DG_23]